MQKVEGAPGSNGFGGGWTMYGPLSTTGHPGPAMHFAILSLCLLPGAERPNLFATWQAAQPSCCKW
jgi:hypothetical protein